MDNVTKAYTLDEAAKSGEIAIIMHAYRYLEGRKNSRISELYSQLMRSEKASNDLYTAFGINLALFDIWYYSDVEVCGDDAHGYVTEYYNTPELAIKALELLLERRNNRTQEELDRYAGDDNFGVRNKEKV